jgi:hypothetical protein
LLAPGGETDKQAYEYIAGNFQRDNIKGERYKKDDKKFNPSMRED